MCVFIFFNYPSVFILFTYSFGCCCCSICYQGEEVWLSGAKKLDTTWEQATDHPSGSKSIWKADLKGQGVKSITGLRINQLRAVRARYPNGCTTDQPLPSGYVCQGNMTDGKVVDPNDGMGTDLITSWVKPTAPGMNQSGWSEFNPDKPFRDTGKSFQTFQLGIGGTCGNDPMLGGVGFSPPAGYWCGNGCMGGAPKPPGCIARWSVFFFFFFFFFLSFFLLFFLCFFSWKRKRH